MQLLGRFYNKPYFHQQTQRCHDCIANCRYQRTSCRQNISSAKNEKKGADTKAKTKAKSQASEEKSAAKKNKQRIQ